MSKGSVSITIAGARWICWYDLSGGRPATRSDPAEPPEFNLEAITSESDRFTDLLPVFRHFGADVALENLAWEAYKGEHP